MAEQASAPLLATVCQPPTCLLNTNVPGDPEVLLFAKPGTDGPGDAGQPGYEYATPAAAGALPPPAGQPPAAAFVCFDEGSSHNTLTCGLPTPVRSVGCGAFALWELPPTPGCDRAYCLAA